MPRHSACAWVSGGVRGLASSRAGRVLGHRVGGQREAAGHLAEDHAAEALGVVLAQPRERLEDLALARLAGVGEPLQRDGLGGEEEQRLGYAGEVVHPALMVIGPKVSFWSQSASPAL